MKKVTLDICLVCVLLMVCTAYAQESYVAGTLRPGDVLRVSVFGMSEFNTMVRIEESGLISFPRCGYVQAAGRTSREVADELADALKKVAADPYVDIFVESWGPRTVFVLGDVVKSGVSLELPTFGYMTALQAISAAGGFAPSADLSKVGVLRRDPKTKELVRHSIDVTALVSDENGGDEFVLQPEDTIVVPKAPPIYISGLVKNPGEYFIDTKRLPQCSEIITRCGGVSVGANTDEVVIVRRSLNNQPNEVITVSLNDIQKDNFASDVLIRPGDHILVKEAGIYVLGEVRSPGLLKTMPDIRLTATKAISFAGGFTQIADRGEVRLIRNGEIIVLNLKKIYKQASNLDDDIELKCGDILFVQESWF